LGGELEAFGAGEVLTLQPHQGPFGDRRSLRGEERAHHGDAGQGVAEPEAVPGAILVDELDGRRLTEGRDDLVLAALGRGP